MDTPTCEGEVHRFLGMVNQMGKFIPHLTDKTKPLRDLLGKGNVFYWGPAQQGAFDQLKTELVSTPTLAQYDPNRQTIISADASSFGLGGVLLQVQDSGERLPCAYASRVMSSCEERYAQVKREGLAVTWAVEKFSDYVLGKDIEIETDQKSLVPLFSSKCLDDLPPRIQRFRMRLMRYSYTISHVPGKQLITADTLSWAPLRKPLSEADKKLNKDLGLYVSSVIEGLLASERRLEQIRLQQDDDEVCRKLKESCTEGWHDRTRLHSSLIPNWPERGGGV